MPLPPGSLLELTPQGLYCPAAAAWIDPWRPVPRALISHAHADHARPGCGEYWAIGSSEGILRRRLGAAIRLLPVEYGQLHRIGDARVSFHSAGHVLGSAQIRLEAGGESWLVSGDYKRCADPSCAPFEPVGADVFITEATFGLPIYRWRDGAAVAAEILAWWQGAPEQTSILFCYAFGKAQRVLAELAALGVGQPGQPGAEGREILLHGAVQALMEPYRQAGVVLPPARPVSELPRGESLAGRLVIAPPAAQGSPWMRRFKQPQTAFVSGWMAVRGARRRRGTERGFVLSDHADWPGLLQSVRQSGARQVYVTHGNSDGLARYLREVEAISAEPLEGDFNAQRGGERLDGEEPAAQPAATLSKDGEGARASVTGAS
ncbi:ligase-associated DNA damage response exonuclease [Vulcanococcus limneticus Candia 3F8]|uniref:ligase-associated DNA damage response exonuclease n=1 Tax=Vulcanococcus limneticus TaxID=2170428 RepID=UPI0018E3962E|nr:ligase-associated DNA damage response exonuclease [Vulcanococcus limneticus]MCP9791850.1 ligase-associated DNA damage response exonuclease [Vulcanococcus limneticus MW73D5]MCP9894386.1 ligase-associated DNA damage response exonuclease [Vulcanococcus limneticus Candia 3F8]MCP9897306.1 ligase-associated DNA damage response exonuclease [Vulcanococcus limneticus Candia 3B3]